MESKTLKHNHHIYEQSYEKRNKLFINVEGRVSPNRVRFYATPHASVQPPPHQKHNTPAENIA